MGRSLKKGGTPQCRQVKKAVSRKQRTAENSLKSRRIERHGLKLQPPAFFKMVQLPLNVGADKAGS